MTPIVLGLDIGGANLKAATSDGRAASVPFSLWKQPGELAEALKKLVAEFPEVASYAITMTGELCDCFRTKADGVAHIVNATEQAVGSGFTVYSVSGAFLQPANAFELWKHTAASNWHALAKFAGRYAPTGPGLLIDCGSTTTDIIPLAHGRPVAKGSTDVARLKSGELVYTGVKRTPLCALLPQGETCAELFATSQDAYVALGFDPEEPTNCDTADGQPLTKDNSEIRLARMLGGDAESVPLDEIQHLARTVIRQQEALLLSASRKVYAHLLSTRPEYVDRPISLICSGSGERLARVVTSRPPVQPERVVSLTEKLGPKLSECAPAYAVAVLAAEGVEA
jgi:(4-(4-[2-(gamma-L-glutamylamino)ethyl]phenoxymethyl)furan-2-yl)methanamine synthase